MDKPFATFVFRYRSMGKLNPPFAPVMKLLWTLWLTVTEDLYAEMITTRPTTHPQDEPLDDSLTIEEMRQLVAQQKEELEREELKQQFRENRKRLEQLRTSVKPHGPLVFLLICYRLRLVRLRRARRGSAPFHYQGRP